MEIIEKKEGAITVIALKGQLDTTKVNTTGEKIYEISQREKILMFDCAELDYICSAGLRLFLLLLNSSREKKGHVALCCIRDNIREIFEVTGLLRMITVYSSVEEGKNELEKKVCISES